MRSIVAGVRTAGAAFAAALAISSIGTAQGQNPTPLKPAAEFDSIADQSARSIALFEEAGKVILHPRCVNCHPAGDTPTQGMEMHVHQPPVIRGDADIGAPGMMCTTCHGPDNFPVAGQAETIKSLSLIHI